MEDKQKQSICKLFEIPSLKDHQIKTLENTLIEKRDSLIILATGMGKSLCFEALTTANSLLHASSSEQAIVLVISPLKFLIEMQVSRLNNIGIPTVSLHHHHHHHHHHI